MNEMLEPESNRKWKLNCSDVTGVGKAGLELVFCVYFNRSLGF